MIVRTYLVGELSEEALDELRRADLAYVVILEGDRDAVRTFGALLLEPLAIEKIPDGLVLRRRAIPEVVEDDTTTPIDPPPHGGKP